MNRLAQASLGVVSSCIPFGMLKGGVGGSLLSPFYHLVSDIELPHIKHLFRYKNVAQFEEDVDFLLKHYTPVDLFEVMAAIKDNKPLPKNSFFLSFDDGLSEIYHVVAPVLQRKGVPATVFISSGFVDGKELFYRHKASLLIDRLQQSNTAAAVQEASRILREIGIRKARLTDAILAVGYKERRVLDQVAEILEVDFEHFLSARCPYLNTEQVKELLGGVFTVGAHSIDHPRYASIAYDEQLRQTRTSMQLISERFSLDYKAFSFPFDDDSISNQLFEELFADQVLDVTFGISGFSNRHDRRNVPRLWMENHTNSAQQRVSQEYLKHRLRGAR